MRRSLKVTMQDVLSPPAPAAVLSWFHSSRPFHMTAKSADTLTNASTNQQQTGYVNHMQRLGAGATGVTTFSRHSQTASPDSQPCPAMHAPDTTKSQMAHLANGQRLTYIACSSAMLSRRPTPRAKEQRRDTLRAITTINHQQKSGKEQYAVFNTHHTHGHAGASHTRSTTNCLDERPREAMRTQAMQISSYQPCALHVCKTKAGPECDVRQHLPQHQRAQQPLPKPAPAAQSAGGQSSAPLTMQVAAQQNMGLKLKSNASTALWPLQCSMTPTHLQKARLHTHMQQVPEKCNVFTCNASQDPPHISRNKVAASSVLHLHC